MLLRKNWSLIQCWFPWVMIQDIQSSGQLMEKHLYMACCYANCIACHHFDLSPVGFRDALSLRYQRLFLKRQRIVMDVAMNSAFNMLWIVKKVDSSLSTIMKLEMLQVIWQLLCTKMLQENQLFRKQMMPMVDQL